VHKRLDVSRFQQGEARGGRTNPGFNKGNITEITVGGSVSHSCGDETKKFSTKKKNRGGGGKPAGDPRSKTSWDLAHWAERGKRKRKENCVAGAGLASWSERQGEKKKRGGTRLTKDGDGEISEGPREI